MHHIQRIDVKFHGWKVLLKRNNRLLHKYFADSQHGGAVAALAAAMAYRDTLMARTSGADYEIWKREVPRPTNTSGTTGIARYVVRASKRSTRPDYPIWQAFYRDLDGKRQKKSFSESAHGKHGARELALQFRREGLEQVHREAQKRLQKSSIAPSRA